MDDLLHCVPLNLILRMFLFFEIHFSTVDFERFTNAVSDVSTHLRGQIMEYYIVGSCGMYGVQEKFARGFVGEI